MARIYVATSWRNKLQPNIVNKLRGEGHQVYDFRWPPHGDAGFHWSQIDPDWEKWTPEGYRDKLLSHPMAAKGFIADIRGMTWCDTCLLVLPSGKSAHLELGWCAGRDKHTLILLDNGEPELMNLLADDICINMDEVLKCLKA